MEVEDYERSSASDGVGHFITALIQNSYNAGHNNFVLYTSNLREKTDKLGWFTKGKSKRLINIKIFGDLGNHCFENGEYLSVEIYGNVGSICGGDVKYSSLKNALHLSSKFTFLTKYFESVELRINSSFMSAAVQSYECTPGLFTI